MVFIFCANFVILASIGGDLSRGQAQNGINCDFKIRFDLETQSQPTPRTTRILNNMFSTSGPNLVTLAWTVTSYPAISSGLTHMDMHTKTQATTIPEGRYNDVIMSVMASQITGVSIVCSTVGSGADQRKYQSSASLALVQGIHRWPTYSLHKRPVTQKGLSFDDVIMSNLAYGKTRTFVLSLFIWKCSYIVYLWTNSYQWEYL